MGREERIGMIITEGRCHLCDIKDELAKQGEFFTCESLRFAIDHDFWRQRDAVLNGTLDVLRSFPVKCNEQT